MVLPPSSGMKSKKSKKHGGDMFLRNVGLSTLRYNRKAVLLLQTSTIPVVFVDLRDFIDLSDFTDLGSILGDGSPDGPA
jgi:hypothetical protein